MLFYKHMRKNGKEYFLVKKETIDEALDYLRFTQSVINEFYNLSVKEYHGKSYNPMRFVWIVEG